MSDKATTPKRKRTTAARLEKRLTEMFGRAASVRCAETFADAGVLTTDRGLVVEFRDGSEFQITIVQSGRGR